MEVYFILNQGEEGFQNIQVFDTIQLEMDKVAAINFTADFVTVLKNLIVYAIIARVLISWFTMGRGRPRGGIGGFIYSATDPVIDLARKIPHRIGMIDFAPLIALFGADLIGQLIIIGLYKLI